MPSSGTTGGSDTTGAGTPVDDPWMAGGRQDGPWPRTTGTVIHNPQPLLLSLSEFNSLKSKGPCVKFRCERDTLVEALDHRRRAVTTRGSTAAALVGDPDRGGREPADRGGHRPRSHRAGRDRGHRPRRRHRGDPGPAGGRHRAVARTGGGDVRGRRRRGRDLARPGRVSWCGPTRSRISPFCPTPGPTRSRCRPPGWPRRCARWCGPPRTTTPGPC